MGWSTAAIVTRRAAKFTEFAEGWQGTTARQGTSDTQSRNPMAAIPAAAMALVVRWRAPPGFGRAMRMLELSEDVQSTIVAHLAHEAGGSASCDSVAAIAALSCASSACRRLVSEARGWELAGTALGLASPLHRRDASLPELCRAASFGHNLCRSRAAEPWEGIHVSLLPRGGGWARELFEVLHPLGWCAVAETAGAAAALPSVPFVIVPCDARCTKAVFDRPADGPLCTLPCARTRSELTVESG